MALRVISIVPLVLFITSLVIDSAFARTFEIDYNKDSFLMDGERFRFISGSIHYFRLPREMWRDRLQKMRAAGLNTISTYVEWSQHEPIPGVYVFNQDLALYEFIQMAQEEGFYVILRLGPYICAERDMGGFPYWLLKLNPNVKLRSNDVRYTDYVKKWFDILLPYIKPLLYGNGGPIITVQIENEYGSHPFIDNDYKNWLRDLIIEHLGGEEEKKYVLFTTDGGYTSALRGGKIKNVYATVDFGPDSDTAQAFAAQRKIEPKGPLVNSECYLGWLTHWGEPMARRDIESAVKTLREILTVGANVNLYMFCGGSNFGFSAGANLGSNYQSDITSYDYDAPITEAGDLTFKYHAIVDVLREFVNVPASTNISDVAPKYAFGPIVLSAVGNLMSPYSRSNLGRSFSNIYPETFEALDQNFGYLLYETLLKAAATNGELAVDVLGDIGNIFINQTNVGVMSRELKANKLNVTGSSGDTLGILVENLGRVNYGIYNNDSKGILSNVTLNGEVLRDWQMTSFDLANIMPIYYCSENAIDACFDSNRGNFRFYLAKFVLENVTYNGDFIGDSFLNVTQLSKGIVFINGKNLGRYWSSRGPQLSVYVPGVWLKPPPYENVLVVLDETSQTDMISLTFDDKPTVTGEVKYIFKG